MVSMSASQFSYRRNYDSALFYNKSNSTICYL